MPAVDDPSPARRAAGLRSSRKGAKPQRRTPSKKRGRRGCVAFLFAFFFAALRLWVRNGASCRRVPMPRTSRDREGAGFTVAPRWPPLPHGRGSSRPAPARTRPTAGKQSDPQPARADSSVMSLFPASDVSLSCTKVGWAERSEAHQSAGHAPSPGPSRSPPPPVDGGFRSALPTLLVTCYLLIGCRGKPHHAKTPSRPRSPEAKNSDAEKWPSLMRRSRVTPRVPAKVGWAERSEAHQSAGHVPSPGPPHSPPLPLNGGFRCALPTLLATC